MPLNCIYISFYFCTYICIFNYNLMEPWISLVLSYNPFSTTITIPEYQIHERIAHDRSSLVSESSWSLKRIINEISTSIWTAHIYKQSCWVGENLTSREIKAASCFQIQAWYSWMHQQKKRKKLFDSKIEITQEQSTSILTANSLHCQPYQTK